VTSNTSLQRTLGWTCQRLGADPYDYICDVLPRLSDLPVKREPGLLATLTPQAWKADRDKKVAKTAKDSSS